MPVPKGYGASFELNIVNALWGQQGFLIQEAFLTTLAQQYGMGMHMLDFVDQPDFARQTINDWVAQQTNNRMPALLAANSIDDLTRLVLTNTVCFQASWAEPFKKRYTKSALFTLIDESTIQVPMMHADLTVEYMANNTYQAAQIPYTGYTMDMWVVLPREGHFATAEAQLGGTFFSELGKQVETYDVKLSLPKFEIGSALELKPLLQSMGLLSAFHEQKADFRAIVDDYELFVADAFHQSTITVDEQSTGATAATNVLSVILSDPWREKSAEMNLNRPFIFAIMHRETGAILFLGRMMNPAEGGS